MSMAKVMIIGNLGRDPETRYTQGGLLTIRFTMATNRRWTDQSGQQQDRTTWFNVTALGKKAETLDKFTQDGVIRKGTQLFVTGRLESRDYQDQNGQPRQSLDVTLEDFQLLGSRADADMQSGGRRSGDEYEQREGSGFDTQDLDEIPF